MNEELVNKCLQICISNKKLIYHVDEFLTGADPVQTTREYLLEIFKSLHSLFDIEQGPYSDVKFRVSIKVILLFV